LGNLQWNRSTKLASSAGLVQTSDGAYVIAGNIFYSAGYADFTVGDVSLLKINQNGNVLWNRTFESLNRVSSMVQTKDGGFILSCNMKIQNNANASSQVTVIKTDSSGKQEWNSTYSEPGNINLVNGIIQTSDGGYLLVGSSSFNGTTDTPNLYFWLAKTGTDGNLTWSHSYGQGPRTISDSGYNRGVFGDNEGYSVFQTADSGYAFLGTAYLPNETERVTSIAKTDTQGNMIWSKTFHSIPNYVDFALTPKSLITTSDGGLAFCESTGQAWLVKTDASGNMEWNKTIGKEERGLFEFGANCLIETRDGALLSAGFGTDAILDQCYVARTETSLPPLPTPLPSPTGINPVATSIVITVDVIVLVLTGLLFVYLKKNRKSKK
jgi:hypothetical protein